MVERLLWLHFLQHYLKKLTLRCKTAGIAVLHLGLAGFDFYELLMLHYL